MDKKNWRNKKTSKRTGKRNPYATSLQSELFQQRVVPDHKKYKRCKEKKIKRNEIEHYE